MDRLAAQFCGHQPGGHAAKRAEGPLGAHSHRNTSVANRRPFRTKAQHAASRRRRRSAKHLAVAADGSCGNLAVNQVHARRADETGHYFVGWLFVESFGAARLQHLAVVQQRDAFGEGQGFRLVVGDVDHGQPEFTLHRLQRLAQPPLGGRLHGGERLIEQHQGHVRAHQRPADGGQLLFKQRKPLGLARQQCRDGQQFRHLTNPAADRSGAPAPIDQRKAEIARHVQGGVEHRKLKHLRHMALGRAGPGDLASVELDGPGARVQKACQQMQQRRFSGPGAA